MKCGCTEDSLCKDAKKLWKRKGFEGRRLYSEHRKQALGLTNEPFTSIWAANLKPSNE